MSSLRSEPYEQKLLRQISKQLPFSLLTSEEIKDLFEDIKIVKYQIGQRLVRADELPERICLITEGRVRLLAKDIDSQEPFTLSVRGSGQLVGWGSLLRGAPCEWVVASETTYVIQIKSDSFLDIFNRSKEFNNAFSELVNAQEVYAVAMAIANNTPTNSSEWLKQIIGSSENILTYSFDPDFPVPPLASNCNWYMSTFGVPECDVGTSIVSGTKVSRIKGYKLNYRLVGLPSDNPNIQSKHSSNLLSNSIQSAEDVPGSTLEQLGILEADILDDSQNYPIVYGKGLVKQSLAVCEMIALHQNTPFRKDILLRLLEEHFTRQKPLSVELIARLCELIGLKCQIGSISTEYLNSIEAPAFFILEDIPVVLFHIKSEEVLIGHPSRGLIYLPINELKELLGSKFVFGLPRRLGSTPTSRFGWSWFTPLIIKYKKSLILVFAASLLSQLFGLAIPLLIQQIIDKVLSQGNLSSLNVLGSAMILLALFQGFLMALRMYIFVDTTDRMDLTLGSAVIDRLLSLPLSFFEKRPVGELSQRIGELNTIRGFLTGTALISVLNIIFATLYLAVMIIYSPLLTAVALSTLPIYFLLIFGVAPIYKMILRKRAEAQAKTQSHLIEVLGGIQTVKAQHFELTARWKWQDKYRDFVNFGFRSSVLGVTTGEIGKFLSQLSGLLVLWVGMWLVLDGNLTLGMLIAFRIISGNVTGPLLQLSGLYQGFQKVQISMERLSDIIDQNSELSNPEELKQIALPPIKGNIKFENVSFRFGNTGPYQVDSVDLTVKEGDFVGIVGQSGSGKSTLVKLIPRLYNTEKGRIFLDNYDVGKVNLSSLRRQIGIVPQDSLLFEGTIAENIALNEPNASDESIIKVSKIACAHDFIMALGKGYASRISERGSNLSGGQRQRIAIARTLLANPQLLIMDEATSALDYNTEKQLCQNLQKWAEDRTVLFITHRLNTIRNSNLILVMDQGRLIEKGTHAELMALNQRYSTLFRQQDG